ncbi:MAG: NADH-quinone oxidoreductase subunit J [Planctomycetales bacterium]
MNGDQGPSFLTLLFAAGSCAGAIAVVLSRNVVRMAFWLIVSLGSVAGLFFLLHADFVGATQLLIYVGGTVVLLIFGVMLTASGPLLKIPTSPAETFLSAGIGALFLAMIVSTVGAVDWKAAAETIARQDPAAGPPVSGEGYNAPEEGNTLRPIGAALLGVRPDRDLGREPGPNGSIALSTGYLLPFEIASVHLLVVLIGAAYLARAKRRRDRDSGESI